MLRESFRGAGMATARKSTKKGAARKSTRGKAASKVQARPTQRKAASAAGKRATKKTPSLESVARKIVRVTKNLSQLKLADLYSESCSSIEPGPGEPVVGLEALDEKLAFWMSSVEQQTWKPRNVWIKGNTIAIQWDADLKFKDGRSVAFEEVAVHEVRGGKIVSERYYYDPSVLAPPPEEVAPEPPVQIRRTGPDPTPPAGSPPLDPIDL